MTFALLLVTSMAAVGTTGGSTGSTAASADTSTTTQFENETADDIYRFANGSAVLVYENQSEDPNEDVQSAQLGADVSSALFNAVVVTNNTENVTGELGVLVQPNSIEGSGDLSIEDEEQVNEFEASLEGEQTREASNAEFELDATVEQEGVSAASDIQTSGELVYGADSLDIDADYSVDRRAGQREAQSRSVTVEETDTGYEVSFDEDRPIREFFRERWNTSEAARNTIQARYQGLTRQYGGSAEVTIEQYDYTEASENSGESDRLDIEYTVELTGVEEGVAGQVVDSLARSQSTDLSPEERDELQDSFTNVTIENVAVTTNQEGSVNEGSVSVSITDYEGAVLNYLDVVAEDMEVINQSDIDSAREKLDARSAADLEQTVTWDISQEATDSGTSYQATVQYDSTNWEAYTTELEERGNPLETELEFSGQATSEGDSIDLTMDFQVNREDIVNSAISDAAEAAAESETEDESAVEAFRSLENAQLQVAKADMVFGEDTVEVRAAAQFENLSTFQGTLDEFPSDVPITHYYAEGDGESSTTYVYVEDLDMSEAEIRETTLADEDTVIHAPGEWEREFPTMDIAGTADYLGVDVDVNKPPNRGEMGSMDTETPTAGGSDGTDAGEDTPTSDDGPGFGLAVALVALLVASLVALRRCD